MGVFVQSKFSLYIDSLNFFLLTLSFHKNFFKYLKNILKLYYPRYSRVIFYQHYLYFFMNLKLLPVFLCYFIKIQKTNFNS